MLTTLFVWAGHAPIVDPVTTQMQQVTTRGRSVHTLLASSYVAVRDRDWLPGPLGAAAPQLTRPRLDGLGVVPGRAQEPIHRRNQGKFPPGSIYTDPVFNAAVRRYFRGLAGRKTPRVVWLDATLDLPELTRLAAADIWQATALRTSRGAV